MPRADAGTPPGLHRGVDVDVVLDKCHVVGLGLLVVCADQDEVDVRLVPHLVVGQAAAQDRRQDVVVLADLLDEGIEGGFEALAGDGRHRRAAHPPVCAMRRAINSTKAVRVM